MHTTLRRRSSSVAHLNIELPLDAKFHADIPCGLWEGMREEGREGCLMQHTRNSECGRQARCTVISLWVHILRCIVFFTYMYNVHARACTCVCACSATSHTANRTARAGTRWSHPRCVAAGIWCTYRSRYIPRPQAASACIATVSTKGVSAG